MRVRVPIYVSGVSGCLELTILGGVFEVIGLGLVAREVTRLQRQEFGPPAWWLRLEGRMRRLLRLSRSQTIHVGGIESAAAFGSDVQVKVTRGPAVLLEDKVRRLEQIAEDLQSDLDAVRARSEKGISRIEQRIGSVEAEMGRARQEEERTRKETIRRQITIQAVGTFLFFVGAVLSVLGNAVTC